ncbi:MAG: hydroxyacid dehydrogenase [Candidatus Poribacteria bacterium]|nr:hydroxyacid dehydrogenase [Candidatus Poribacteria bacterium]|tara:strand:+ start:1095 stop:2042 length:948 start_codon:yes stop_codon:yes gene_type:complete
MKKILVTEAIHGQALEHLKHEFSVTVNPSLWKKSEQLRQIIGNYDGLIIRNQTIIDQKLVSAAGRLRVIGRHGVGLDNIDLRATKSAELIVTFAPEQNAVSVAELALGLMLSLARKIPEANQVTKNGNWERQRFEGSEIFGKKLGIVGLGKIGYRVGTRARAFGMSILAHDTLISSDSLNITEIRADLVSLEDLLTESDFVTCHLPLTQKTEKMFNYQAFSRMKKNAYFINLARGGLVDETDLIKALQEELIAGVALDVRAIEPPTTGKLEKTGRVILTPHIAGLTKEARERVLACVCQDVALVLKGESPHYPVV